MHLLLAVGKTGLGIVKTGTHLAEVSAWFLYPTRVYTSSSLVCYQVIEKLRTIRALRCCFSASYLFTYLTDIFVAHCRGCNSIQSNIKLKQRIEVSLSVTAYVNDFLTIQSCSRSDELHHLLVQLGDLRAIYVSSSRWRAT